jgi:hypothetical protein
MAAAPAEAKRGQDTLHFAPTVQQLFWSAFSWSPVVGPDRLLWFSGHEILEHAF